MNELTIHDNRPLTAANIRANVNLIQEVMKSVMKKDIHYGTIPGTNKPTLYKAGSEKILSTFRIAVELDVDDLSSNDCYRFRVKARGVLPSGEIVGCGIGECSTEEEKYKWRGAVCPAEFEHTPDDRKRVKYTKPNTYNATGEIKQVRTNPADLANTALKMAKKRAQIDLTLTATGASDVFDQDIEDLPEEYREGMQKPPVNKAAAAVEKINAAKDSAQQESQPEPTDKRAKYNQRIEVALKALYGDDKEAMKAKVIELTTWEKDGNEVKGTANYAAIKNEKAVEILCHKLEKMIPVQAKESSGDALQEVYRLVQKLSDIWGETPDDTIDKLTDGKVSAQIDLSEKSAAYLADIKISLESAISKGA